MKRRNTPRNPTVYGVENWSSGVLRYQWKRAHRRSASQGRSSFGRSQGPGGFAAARIACCNFPCSSAFANADSQLRELSAAYQHGHNRIRLPGSALSVFPMKVNPRREVVEEFLRDSARCRVGWNAVRKPNCTRPSRRSRPRSHCCSAMASRTRPSSDRHAGRRGWQTRGDIVEKLNELKMVIKSCSTAGHAR